MTNYKKICIIRKNTMGEEKILAFFRVPCYDKNPPQKLKSFTQFFKNLCKQFDFYQNQRF